MNSFARASEEGNLLELHPSVKPVALVADAIMDASHRGDIVLDPFLGSGSTTPNVNANSPEQTGSNPSGMFSSINLERS
jgi:hypothetical protein